MTDTQIGQRQRQIGNGLIRFSGAVLLVGSVVKFLHPAKAAAYMAFFGYENERLLMVAILEFVVAVMFLMRFTRPVGLLLSSAYLGGAIAVHVAYHPVVTTTPILAFDSSHPYLGCIPPVLVLFSTWGGIWLRYGSLPGLVERTRTEIAESAADAA